MNLSISRFVEGGLSRADFEQLEMAIEGIAQEYRLGKLSSEEVKRISRSFGEDFLRETMQGHALQKPYGYAGDFMIIDKIYTEHKSAIDKYGIWDEFFHRQSAPKAVRNRKKYFVDLMHSVVGRQQGISLLNVASGPARDLLELFERLDDTTTLKVRCVDIDAEAIQYAKALNAKYLSHITFTQGNIFLHKEEKQYDVIWSGGLFDYFNDKAFVLVLKKFKNWLKKGGEIVIGNFNADHNPSRAYMELFGEWHLIHRSAEELRGLAIQAGFDGENISITTEEERVNLFLHVKK